LVALDALLAAHVRSERFRDFDGAVRVLVVFEDGDHHAPDGGARGVQRVEIVGRLVTLGTVSEPGPAGLERLEVRSRGDFEPTTARLGTLFHVVAGSPDLQVVGPRRGEGEIAGTEI